MRNLHLNQGFSLNYSKNHYTKTGIKMQIKKRKQQRGECLGSQVNNDNAVDLIQSTAEYILESTCMMV